MDHAIELVPSVESDRTALNHQIETLIARLHPTVVRERRRDERIAIPVLFRLTPLDANHEPLAGHATIVVGKNISRRGLSFFHEKPIPHRRALIELTHPGLGSFAAEIDVSWCRFTRPGWYESGGRLMRSHVENIHDEAGKVSLFVPAVDGFIESAGGIDASAPCRI